MPDLPLEITLDGGKGIRGSLHSISMTGGCAVVSAQAGEGILAEIAFSTKFGTVRAIAELLKPQLSNGKKLQAFRFVAVSEDDHKRLRAAMNAD